MSYQKRFVSALVVVLGMFGIMGVAQADSEEGYIKYRQAVMKSAAGHLSAAKSIVYGSVKLDGQLQAHADALADMAVMIPAVFPEGSDFGDTDAKPEVWEQPDEFLQAIKKYEEASAAFAAGPSLDSFEAVSDACKSCHKEFREK